jgi:hypothetical protein
MTTFRIKTTSWGLWLLTLMVTLLGGAFFIITLLPKNTTISVVSVLSLTVLAFFLQRFTSLGIVTINLNINDISINWVKQLIFNNQSNRHFPLSDIESYNYQPDIIFDLFRLTLKDGTEISLWHFTLTSGDDFDRLIADFSQVVSEHNRQKHISSHSEKLPTKELEIKREKTFYESKGSPFFKILAIIFIVTIPIFLYLYPGDKPTNPFVLLAPIAGATFYMIQFFKYRKQKKNEPL